MKDEGKADLYDAQAYGLLTAMKLRRGGASFFLLLPRGTSDAPPLLIAPGAFIGGCAPGAKWGIEGCRCRLSSGCGSKGLRVLRRLNVSE